MTSPGLQHSSAPETTSSAPSTAQRGGLETALKPRHITMISIAGVIGAGLFVGSAKAIATAGRPSSSPTHWPARSSSW